jgi:hypothetical protein
MMEAARSEGLVVRAGGRPRSELVEALRDASVQLNAHAETLIAHSAFDDPVGRPLRIVERTAAQLGFEQGAVQSRVFAAAQDQGLELCPLVNGSYLRLAMMDQMDAPDSVLSAGRGPSGAIHIGSKPVSEDVEYPKGSTCVLWTDRLG